MNFIDSLKITFFTRKISKITGKIEYYGNIYTAIPDVIMSQVNTLEHWKTVEKSLILRKSRVNDLKILKSTGGITKEEESELRDLILFMSGASKLAKTAALIGVLSGEEMITFRDIFKSLDANLQKLRETIDDIENKDFMKNAYRVGEIIKEHSAKLAESAKRLKSKLRETVHRSEKECTLTQKEIDAMMNEIKDNEINAFDRLNNLNTTSIDKLKDLMKIVEAN